MARYGERLIKGTSKGISLIAFETSKKSRIMKKKMRMTALGKEVKADLRDLGSLALGAIKEKNFALLEDEEISVLVEAIDKNKVEIERLRESIARLSRARKHFAHDEDDFEEADVDVPKAAIDETDGVPLELEPVKAEVKEEAPSLEPEPKVAVEKPKKKAAPKKRATSKSATAKKDSSKATAKAKPAKGEKGAKKAKAPSAPKAKKKTEKSSD